VQITAFIPTLTALTVAIVASVFWVTVESTNKVRNTDSYLTVCVGGFVTRTGEFDLAAAIRLSYAVVQIFTMKPDD
jgi:hypothetical protein